MFCFWECKLIKYYISCTEQGAHRFIEMCIYNKWWEIRELCLTLLCNPFVADLTETSLMSFPSHILSPLSPHRNIIQNKSFIPVLVLAILSFLKWHNEWNTSRYLQNSFPEDIIKKKSDQTKPYMLCCIIWLKMQCVDLA